MDLDESATDLSATDLSATDLPKTVHSRLPVMA
jgi:hypothetical protein